MLRELRGARFLWNRVRRVTRRLDSIRFQGESRRGDYVIRNCWRKVDSCARMNEEGSEHGSAERAMIMKRGSSKGERGVYDILPGV